VRRIAPAPELLPSEFRDFDPRKWLKPGEDESDPIRCHITALLRYKDAVRAATGVRDPHDVASVVIDHWFAPSATRKQGECPCTHCETVTRRPVQTDGQTARRTMDSDLSTPK
jgi:hypothetical protein